MTLADILAGASGVGMLTLLFAFVAMATVRVTLDDD